MDIRHAWIKKINITFEFLNLIADIDEFWGSLESDADPPPRSGLPRSSA